MIKCYWSFNEDKILESLINESMLYYSPKLRNNLNKISNNKVAKELIDKEGNDSGQDVTFLDVDNSLDGYLTFITMKNAEKLLNVKHKHLTSDIDGMNNNFLPTISDSLWELDKMDSSLSPKIWTKSRNQIKIGKLVNKLLPGKFTDKEIEEFVNLLKSTIDKSNEKFELVEGEDIPKWYSYINYKERKGSLGSSCMRNASSSYFEIYYNNPEVCKMLILKEDDKILGRALVWKLNSIKGVDGNPEWFMDRQYTIEDSDVNKFRDYAQKMGWCYKTRNSHDSFKKVTFNDVIYDRVDMTVQLKPVSKNNYKYSRYPYLDTFRRYDPENGILYNDDEQENNGGQYILDNTSGGYTEIHDGVWSEWEGEYIDENDAVWSEPIDSYLHVSRAVQVERGGRRNRGWWPDSHDSIVYDDWLDEYVHIDDTIWSDYHGKYFYSDNAISAVRKISKYGDTNGDHYWIHESDTEDGETAVDISDVDHMTWFKVLSDSTRPMGSDSWDDHRAIMMDLLTKNYQDEWIPNIFSMKAYKAVDLEDEYLSEIDAKALGLDINKNDSILIDKFEYEKECKDSGLLPKIKEGLEKIKVEYEIIVSGKQSRLEFEDDEEYINGIKSRLERVNKRIDEIEEEKWL